MFLTFLNCAALIVSDLNSNNFPRNTCWGTTLPLTLSSPRGGAANVILLPVTVNATPGSCITPSNVIINACSL